MDRESQYFIAEATQTLNLSDPTKYEREEDALWAGCSAVARRNKLCEVSIARRTPREKTGEQRAEQKAERSGQQLIRRLEHH